ncbi:CASP-like protein 4A3 [Phragmites australis]|uniref:CASP-like protein 4A3 n=1 Tax=Phragmites australis TaxID=29695 RepID=UPI002D7A1F5C|nr:CASP-like protein 4A3 [Phragmites australis]
MASPIRPPPPPPPVEPLVPSSPPSQHPAVDPSPHGSISPENPTPAPPPPPPPPGPTAISPPNRSGDSSPSSPPHPPTPLPPPSADPSTPLPREDQTSPPRSPPHPTPAPIAPPPPAPVSSEARSEHKETESASESGSMTLALALTQTEESTPPTPPKASSAAASPTGSPQKESALTIAKLLSGEDPTAAEAKPAADKVAPRSDTGSLAAVTAATSGGGGGGGARSKRWLLGDGVPEKVRRAELRRAELGFRVSAAVFCLVSLSVMATDTTTGWSGDSFRRYNEYRYVLAASVVAFTYSGLQLVAEVHYLVTGRRIIRAPLRSYINLAMDQMLAYLLLSASSAALSRNDVWVSRFGGDQFTKLINASASMAFLAFIALGLSSIVSAYCVFSAIS